MVLHDRATPTRFPANIFLCPVGQQPFAFNTKCVTPVGLEYAAHIDIQNLVDVDQSRITINQFLFSLYKLKKLVYNARMIVSSTRQPCFIQF